MTGTEIVPVWGATTVAALIFPFGERARGTRDFSPPEMLKSPDIPLGGRGAVVSRVWPGIPFYFLSFAGEMRDSNGDTWILLRDRLDRGYRLILHLEAAPAGAWAWTPP